MPTVTLLLAGRHVELCTVQLSFRPSSGKFNKENSESFTALIVVSDLQTMKSFPGMNIYPLPPKIFFCSCKSIYFSSFEEENEIYYTAPADVDTVCHVRCEVIYWHFVRLDIYCSEATGCDGMISNSTSLCVYVPVRNTGAMPQLYLSEMNPLSTKCREQQIGFQSHA